LGSIISAHRIDPTCRQPSHTAPDNESEKQRERKREEEQHKSKKLKLVAGTTVPAPAGPATAHSNNIGFASGIQPEPQLEARRLL
jgi:hypothetical protein